jgi:type IV fimbrial biogenesis protein FimT
MRHAWAYGQRGLTLIEVMIALGILGVIAALALPSFEGFRDRERVKGVANNLVADMQFARSEAVQRSRRVSVSFTLGVNWCYGIHQVEDGGPVECNCTPNANASNSCNIKVVRGSDVPGVQLSSASFGAGDAWYSIDPRRGQILDSTGAAAQGAVGFTGGSGARLDAELNAVGRVRLCSPDSKIGGFPACS